VTAPKNATEMLGLLRAGVNHKAGPFAIRYPRDAAPDSPPPMASIEAVPYGTWEVVRQGEDVAVLAVGTMVSTSLAAAEAMAAEGLKITVVNCRYLKPYDEVTLAAILAHHKQILIVEEGTVVNGFGAFMSSVIGRYDSAIRVIHAASRTRQLAMCGLDATGIANRVRALLESEAMAG
jgi:1-deoxy-D-xylulose-5-phosphate synthase